MGIQAGPLTWYGIRPDQTMLDEAQRKLKEGDARKSNNMVNFSPNRWAGFVAERVFNEWLDEHEVPFQWLEDDSSTDFVVANTPVGVKCCGSKHPWKPSLVVNVYERHRKSSPSELFFIGREDGGLFLLLGGMSKEQFFDTATFVAKGQWINPRTVAQNDVWNLPTQMLENPNDWLGRIT